MKTKGFTLIEMVMVIVIMSVVFLGVGSLVRISMQGYTETVDRQGIQNQARFVIEKISRDIRHAVPNSFKVDTTTVTDAATNTTTITQQCLSFYPIDAVGFYSRNEVNNTIQFAMDNQGSKLSDANKKLTINPSRPDDLLTSTSNQSASLTACLDAAQSCKEYQTSENSGVYYYEMKNDFSSHSVANRYFIYKDLVKYCIAAGNITKTVGNGGAVIVGAGLDISGSLFKYKEAALQRGGLVHIELLFINNDEKSFYQHDVQVLNVP